MGKVLASINITRFFILKYNCFPLQSEFTGFSHPETGAHMADILIDEAIKVGIKILYVLEQSE